MRGCLLATVAVAQLLAATGPSAADGPAPVEGAGFGRLRIADEVPYALAAPEPYGFASTSAARTVWRHEIALEGATSIAAHFSFFDLPPGDELVLRDPGNRRVWSYRESGNARRGRAGGFWSVHVPGERLLLELRSRGGDVELPEGRSPGFVVDALARGFDPAVFAPEAICGADDKAHAQCYTASNPSIFARSRPVARLTIQGMFLCTGWLVGSEGHLMTNNHCMSTEAEIDDTNYEFLAEGSCAQSCPTLACPGTIAATSGTLVKTNSELDYTLVRLATNPAPAYGFLQMRATPTVVGERIYLPQHPAGRGKEIAVLSTDPHDPTGFPEIDSISIIGAGRLGTYYADTEGGSSGSPVLGFADHCVVVLHQAASTCDTFGNLGGLSNKIVTDLGGLVPKHAAPSGGCANFPIFVDGFTTGSTSVWSDVEP